MKTPKDVDSTDADRNPIDADIRVFLRQFELAI